MYIGLLEDEPHLAQHVCEILEGAGHTVSVFNNGADMVRAIGRDTIDLFVLDWRVPRMSGLEVLKHIRDVRSLKEPVLFLTSRTDEQDITEALNAGADDYCLKPIRSNVLIARINALFRFAYKEVYEQAHIRQFFDYRFDLISKTIFLSDQQVPVLANDFKLALHFFENFDVCFSYQDLLQVIKADDLEIESCLLPSAISRLRKSLNIWPSSTGVSLKTIYGFGYRLTSVTHQDAS
jgi:two-component system response regulator RegX3